MKQRFSVHLKAETPVRIDRKDVYIARSKGQMSPFEVLREHLEADGTMEDYPGGVTIEYLGDEK